MKEIVCILIGIVVILFGAIRIQTDGLIIMIAGISFILGMMNSHIDPVLNEE